MTLNILAIDSSSDACSVACYRDGYIVAEQFVLAPYQHSLYILDFVKQVLATSDLNLAQLNAIAFGCGPGSFTGLRLAASITQGLAFAHNLPVIEISTLQAMAQGAYAETGATHILVAVDARTNEIYWGEYALSNNGCMELITPSSATQNNTVNNRTNNFGKLGKAEDVVVAASSATLFIAAEKKEKTTEKYAKKVSEENNEEKTKQEDTAQKNKNNFLTGIGNAWAIYGETLQERCRQQQCAILVNNTQCYPHARYIAQLGAIAYKTGKMTTADAALPIYLREEIVKCKEQENMQTN